MHDGPRGHGEMVSTPWAIPLAPVLNLGNLQIPASRAGDPVRPAQSLQVASAGIIRIETTQKGDKVHGSDS